MKRVAILYRTTDEPWGGGNSFLRSLKETWRAQHIEVVEEVQDSLDGVLINSYNAGPGLAHSPRTIARLVRTGYASALRVWLAGSRWKRERPPFVHRLDGVFRLYGRRPDDPADRAQIEINAHLDWTIYQSEYCRQSFAAEGMDVTRSTVVFNGVDLQRFRPASELSDARVLRLMAASWSPNLKKGFADLVRASQLPGVTVTFVGRWPSEVNPEGVKVIPPQRHEVLAGLYRQHHALLHMARNEPCSNTILEALASGLPVIYHPSGGSPEIVGSSGLAGEPDLAAAVEELRDRYGELRDEVLAHRHERSIERAADKYRQVFEQLGQVPV